MSIQPGHRKRVKHVEHPGHVRELTFSCYQRRPLLDDDWRREQLSVAITRALARYPWRLAAFVYMPEHVHLLVYPTTAPADVSRLLFAVKRPVSYRVKQRLADSGDPILRDLTVRQRPGRTTFRFWQEGPGYDRNLAEPEAVLAAIDYLHRNPVSRGLCQRARDYRWSSARWYESNGVAVDPALPPLAKLPAAFLHEA
ncbi:MAG: hypothetical protein CMJ58_19100 [Planctomycetaceae bacterium]|nr:hypothetical protein [Planctomycetaceae bacterium]